MDEIKNPCHKSLDMRLSSPPTSWAVWSEFFCLLTLPDWHSAEIDRLHLHIFLKIHICRMGWRDLPLALLPPLIRIHCLLGVVYSDAAAFLDFQANKLVGTKHNLVQILFTFCLIMGRWKAIWMTCSSVVFNFIWGKCKFWLFECWWLFRLVKCTIYILIIAPQILGNFLYKKSSDCVYQTRPTYCAP